MYAPRVGQAHGETAARGLTFDARMRAPDHWRGDRTLDWASPLSGYAAESLWLQRKCACNGSRGVAAPACATCGGSDASTSRLSVGSASDPMEAEAEQFADAFGSGVHAGPVSRAPSHIQRRAAQEGASQAVPASVGEVLGSPGSPLDASLRHEMEQYFAHDFSRVRVHADTAAGHSAQGIDANAYTVGRHIAFAPGMFAPHTPVGRRLVAHELTHVIQQGAAPLAGTHDARAPQAGATPRAPARVSVDSPGNTIRRDSLLGQAVERVRQAIDPETRQFLSDLKDSVVESPQYVAEFFTGELFDTVKEHWIRITLVTGGLIGAQALIGALEGAPTGITQIVGAILEIIVLGVLGYFAAAETKDAVEQGMKWWAVARGAKGDKARIASASREFVRMIWHIVMAVMAVAGVRARIRADALGRISAPLRGAPPVEPAPAGVPPVAPAPSGAPPEAPAGRTPLRSVPKTGDGKVEMRNGRVVSRPSPRPVGSRGVINDHFDGSLARNIEPEPVSPPEPPPLYEVPQPQEIPDVEPASTPKAPATPQAKGPHQPKIKLPPLAGRLRGRADVPEEGEYDDHGCFYLPIAMQFGRYPCHADYARSLSGESREFRVTEPGGESADFDAMDQLRNLYEVKTGYGWMWSNRPKDKAKINGTRARFIDQSIRQYYIASMCGKELTWYFNDKSAARYFAEVQPLLPPVKHRPFNCKVDSDEPQTLTP